MNGTVLFWSLVSLGAFMESAGRTGWYGAFAWLCGCGFAFLASAVWGAPQRQPGDVRKLRFR